MRGREIIWIRFIGMDRIVPLDGHTQEQLAAVIHPRSAGRDMVKESFWRIVTLLAGWYFFTSKSDEFAYRV